MLCDVCQTREAKIFYTEIVNGQKKEQHLCEQCASEYTPIPINEIMGGQGLSAVGSILSGILSNYARDRGKKLANEKKGETVCPECGTTESEFLKTGRTGCPVCYNVFRDMIAKNFKTMQGGMSHTGKEPAFARFIQIDDTPVVNKGTRKGGNLEKSLNLEDDEDYIEITENKTPRKPASGKKTSTKSADTIETLKEKMKNAVAEEDYELAAKLRDEIKKKESKKAPKEVKNEKKKT